MSRPATAADVGLVGPAARACGARARRAPRLPLRHLPLRPHPGLAPGTPATCFARAYVRWLEVQRSLAFVREQLRRAARRAGSARTVGRAAAGHAGRVAGRRLARRDLPRGHDRRRRAGSRATRWSIRRSTTGSAWRWPCATSRSPISRCATRASICPTAGTTCERDGPDRRSHAGRAAHAPEPEASHDAVSGRAAARAARAVRRPAGIGGAPAASRGCRRCAAVCPTERHRPTAATGLRLDTGPLPVLPARARPPARPARSRFSRDYRLAARRREDLVVAARRITPPARRSTRATPRGSSAGPSSSARSAPAAATPARPTPTCWAPSPGTWAASASSSWPRRATPTGC